MDQQQQPEAAIPASRRLSGPLLWEQARLPHSQRPVPHLLLAEDHLRSGAIRVVVAVAEVVGDPGVARRAGGLPSC